MADPIPTDPLEAWRASRDAMRKMQQLITKMTVPAAQRQAMAETMAKMVMPGEQLNAMIELAETFGPPTAQIEQVQATLAAHRVQVDEMSADLERLELMVERLALAAEAISMSQVPFRSMMNQLSTTPPDTE